LLSANQSARKILGSRLHSAWKEAQDRLSDYEKRRLQTAKVGVILASTKSFVDDFIWDASDEQLENDAMAPLLADFVENAKLTPQRTLTVSNACASSLSALYVAKHWLSSGTVTDVWLIAADRVGPFVLQGFHSLHALSEEKVRPFASSRSGLQLGDGAAAILLSSACEDTSVRLHLQGVGIDTEGYAVTRPSSSGESLRRACLLIKNIQEAPPELVIAHGTATLLNDPAEDQAFASLFAAKNSPLVTGSKWCIGHTLGASGAMDLIAACEILKRQEVFRIANTVEVDPAFSGRYLAAQHTYDVPSKLNKILITSLGFGGVNAAAMVELKRTST
jgi:3-oxoacyl-(acyl-carrier-protein) synthase